MKILSIECTKFYTDAKTSMCDPHCISYITKLSQNQIVIHSFCTEPLYSTQLDVDNNKGINSTVLICLFLKNIAKNLWVRRDISLHLLVP